MFNFDKNKNIFAFQGRALGKSNTKYITIILDESIPKIYGLDTVDLSQRVYVFEGPIDSMFVPNSIATAGGDMVSSLKDFDKKNLVIVYDKQIMHSKIHTEVYNIYYLAERNNIIYFAEKSNEIAKEIVLFYSKNKKPARKGRAGFRKGVRPGLRRQAWS